MENFLKNIQLGEGSHRWLKAFPLESSIAVLEYPHFQHHFIVDPPKSILREEFSYLSQKPSLLKLKKLSLIEPTHLLLILTNSCLRFCCLYLLLIQLWMPNVFSSDYN